MVYGLLTVLNIKDMGFFIPHRYAAGLERNKIKLLDTQVVFRRQNRCVFRYS